ncbi:LarC family nickel insertion protein [Paenibacillus solani]|uniref:LarC family nickel insertion protein n=1 Tax=Paenibacillus solani TaxID=1705565 RepID=UPI002415641F|nr:nickel insertion protein [Paenibacillus solani]
MFIGALIDAGADPFRLQEELKKLRIEEEYELTWNKVVKNGITSTKFDVLLTGDASQHDHAHQHDHSHDHAEHVHVHDHSHSRDHSHHHDHSGSHDHAEHVHVHGHGDDQSHSHEHSHNHEHSHQHDHSGSHSHAKHEHVHEHGDAHSHSHEHADHLHIHADGHDHSHSHDNADHVHPHEHVHDHSHDHHHGHHHHDHRSYKDIVRMIEHAGFEQPIQDIALRIFKKIGEAEGQIHGVPLEKVHFHEVGAVDSIIDIVGAAILIHQLEIDMIQSSPVPVGKGKIRIDHGIYPVPAPATLEILRGAPLEQSDIRGELTTPTGAAIVSVLAEAYGPIPSMRVRSIGYGAGTKTFAEHPNVLRVIIGD